MRRVLASETKTLMFISGKRSYYACDHYGLI